MKVRIEISDSMDLIERDSGAFGEISELFDGQVAVLGLNPFKFVKNQCNIPGRFSCQELMSQVYPT